MGLPDLRPSRIVGLGVVPVLADEVRADGEIVVRVGLAVGHRRRRPGIAILPGLDVAEGELIPAFVVALGLLPVAAVLRRVGGAHAEVVRLHLAVARAVGARDVLLDAGQEAAGRVAFLHVGVDLHLELVVPGMTDLHAVQRLAVGCVGLAAHMVADARLGHEVAFVGRVDEHLAGELTSALHDDLHDASVLLHHALLQVETFAVDDGHLVAGGLDHRVIDQRGHVRLEGPHGILGGAVAVRSAGEIVLPRLLTPLGGVGVVPVDALVEFTRHPANRALVADVGRTEPAGGQAAEELRRLDEDGRPAVARGLDGGGDAPRGAPVDHDVGLFGGEQGG